MKLNNLQFFQSAQVDTIAKTRKKAFRFELAVEYDQVIHDYSAKK